MFASCALPVALTTDAAIIAEMDSVLGRLEADTSELVQDPLRADIVEWHLRWVAEATNTLERLSAAQPSSCLAPRLMTYRSRLTDFRSAVEASATASGPQSAADGALLLSSFLGMGEAVEDAFGTERFVDVLELDHERRWWVGSDG